MQNKLQNVNQCAIFLH